MNNDGSRPIRFPINRTLVPTQEGGSFESPPQVSPVWQVESTTQKVTITMTLSLDEFVMLASAIDVGRDIAYGVDAIEVWKVWTGAVNTMALCEQVADCIETNEAVRNAIGAMMSDGGNSLAPLGGQTNVGTNSALFSDDNLLENIACNDDAIFGACVALVQFMNIIAQDWIESALVLSSGAELGGYVAQTIPLANSLGVDYGDLVDWVGDEVLTLYTGGYDTALMLEASCLLYARACVTCELTLDDLFEVFASKSSISLNPVVAWANFIQDVITLRPADGLVYAVWALVTGTWKAGSVFTSVSGIGALEYSARISVPDTRWQSECDPCATSWEYVVDFDNLPPEFNIVSGTVSAGRLNVAQVGNNRQCDIRFTIPSTTVTEIEFGGFNAGSSGDSEAFSGIDTTPSPVVLLLGGAQTDAGTRDFLWQGSRQITSMRFFCESLDGNAGYIDKIILRGTGTNPFI